MAKYPSINQGLGKLTPDMWKRMMDALKDNEEYRENAGMKVRDRGNRRSTRGASGASNTIRVKNTGDNPISALEACVVQHPQVQTQLALCEDCEGETVCPFGACGVWPGGGEYEYPESPYAHVYKQIRSMSIVLEVKDGQSAAATDRGAKPMPGRLLDVLVAADDIPAGDYGLCYATGFHWAWIWDPRGLCNGSTALQNTNGTFHQHEMLYADLPDIQMSWDDEDDSMVGTQLCQFSPFEGHYNVGNTFQYKPYYENGNGIERFNQTDGEAKPLIYCPLVARPQGRYKVHWIDPTFELYLPESDGGGQEKWPIAEWLTISASSLGTEYALPRGVVDPSQRSRIRMALVERLSKWHVPTVPVQIQAYEYWNHDRGGDTPLPYADRLKFQYSWRALLDGTYGSETADYFEHWRLGQYGRAVNWAEWHNCQCDQDDCSDCLDGSIGAQLPNNYAGGVQIEKLDKCFGVGQWTLMAAAGFSCDFSTIGKQSIVNMTMGIDELGNQLPSFNLQNAVQGAC